ncbi:MAG TPA: cysteine hydrolase family protein [Candidatus Nanoarchaeia archaeon]|nr:cysteine hydrolase family protein [Candidatus Nanoarchaeia archaeon]
MKTIFWNVDTQYDFMRNDEDHRGTLFVPGAREIEQNLSLLTDYAKVKKIQVVNTGDWHNEDSEELSDKPDFITKFPKHCMIGTRGAEFVPATNPESPYVVDWRATSIELENVAKARNIILYKDKFGAFQGTKYASAVVQAISPQRAIVYGVATNVCVDFAVIGLLERKVEVYAVTDAMKELPNIPLPYEAWKELGAKLVTTKEILEGRI